ITLEALLPIIVDSLTSVDGEKS
ncbi:MAG: hypothetical protein K0Q59_5498, partial [Paenibacillus sp.]|nr:hypothetical protein [Paenibacillus sp.]